MEAFHEPPAEGAGPTGCRPGPLTRRVKRFIVPMHAQKRNGAFHEPQGAAGILPAAVSGRSPADETSAAPCWRHCPTYSTFMVPMRGKKAAWFFPGECRIHLSHPGYSRVHLSADSSAALRTRASR